MEALITIFIGLVAVALIIIAAGIGAVAWCLVKLLQELTVITRRLHEAGEAAASDLGDLRETIRGAGSRLGSIGDIIMGLVAARFATPARKKPRPIKRTPRMDGMRAAGEETEE